MSATMTDTLGLGTSLALAAPALGKRGGHADATDEETANASPILRGS